MKLMWSCSLMNFALGSKQNNSIVDVKNYSVERRWEFMSKFSKLSPEKYPCHSWSHVSWKQWRNSSYDSVVILWSCLCYHIYSGFSSLIGNGAKTQAFHTQRILMVVKKYTIFIFLIITLEFFCITLQIYLTTNCGICTGTGRLI